MMVKGENGDKVEIIKTLAPDWKKVGFLMDLDPTGLEVKCIEAEYAHRVNDPIICCQEVFLRWLDTQRATWGNLIELLIDSEQKELAKQVKDAMGLLDTTELSFTYSLFQ